MVEGSFSVQLKSKLNNIKKKSIAMKRYGGLDLYFILLTILIFKYYRTTNNMLYCSI